MNLIDRIKSSGPKRILALDGGGVRGIISLQFLKQIEQLLQQRTSNFSLKLADYFDLIGGTSTGAIIAALLCMGKTVDYIIARYHDLAREAFNPLKLNKLVARYNEKSLKQIMEKEFRDIEFHSETLRTGLCVIAKRVDNGSTWLVHNHPESKDIRHNLNQSFLLRDVVRASTAAPTYFVPEILTDALLERGPIALIDGGVSMANDPALFLFLMAVSPGYDYRWALGEDNLFLVSVGTGEWRRNDPAEKVRNRKFWNWASEVPSMLIDDAMTQSQMILQALSHSLTPRGFFGQFGQSSGYLLTGKPLLSYVRYNAMLDEDGLKAIGQDELIPDLSSLRKMEIGKNVDKLSDIGRLTASTSIKGEQFPVKFDPRKVTG